jgi:hypothetical protein
MLKDIRAGNLKFSKSQGIRQKKKIDMAMKKGY